MDTHNVKCLADDIAAISRAEAWLEDHGDIAFVNGGLYVRISIEFAAGMSGHEEAQGIVQEVVSNLGDEILIRALGLCNSRRRELTEALRAEIGSD